MRDASYLQSVYQNHGSDCSHNYRDSKIDSFRMAIEWLLYEKGAFVVRTGKIAERPMGLESKCFVDLPFTHSRSDFIDIWLFMNAGFVVTTGSGPDIIPQMINTPIVGVNYNPIARAPYWSRGLFLSSRVMCTRRGRMLTVEELASIDILKSREYSEKGLILSPRDEKEIFSAIKEGWTTTDEHPVRTKRVDNI